MLYSDVSDEQLVNEFKEGNHAVFEELVNRHHSNIYRLVFSYLKNAHDAEEITQDTFVKAFQHLDTFRSEARFSTWLYRIAVNLSKNKLSWRKSRREQMKMSINEEDEESGLPKVRNLQASHLTMPDHQLSTKEYHRMVMDEIEKLPENFREILKLLHVNELSYEEISEVLDCKMGTVKSRIARAREELRKRVGHL